MDYIAFQSELRQIYPPDRLLTKDAQLAPYESDALTSFRSRPNAVVIAADQQEVIETVRLCHRAGVPFVARGSGTSLSGGSLPVEGGIVDRHEPPQPHPAARTGRAHRSRRGGDGQPGYQQGRFARTVCTMPRTPPASQSARLAATWHSTPAGHIV